MDVQYGDWGERCARWAGVRSQTVQVHGTDVHLLRADAHPAAPPDAPTHLLLHPMGGGGTMWLDVLPGLTAHGPVIAPDLPGTLLGHTTASHRDAIRPDAAAQFLRAFAATLELDRLVVHGWSMGGLVALLFVDREPERVARLVLTDPTLPGPMTTGERRGWQTVGRLALAAGPLAVRGLLRVLGPRLLALKQRAWSNPQALPTSLNAAGGILSRISPELSALMAEELQAARSQPRRLGDTVTAFTSVVSAMYVDRRPAIEAIGRLAAPTLLLWGDQDPLIERATIDQLTGQRPDWQLRVFETVGHCLPWEVPTAYVEAVGGWLAGHQEPPGGPAAVGDSRV